MNTVSDSQLLEAYAHENSEEAFRELVARRVGLVYSAALRETNGNHPLAQDITQAVFTELARRAQTLTRHPALSGWLYTCVRRTTANVRRSENRRQLREQQAFNMNPPTDSSSEHALWSQVRPVLDDVMHELSEKERSTVVLRYFENRSHREIGETLGLNENAARMRVDRALEKLRGLLARRGIKSTASTLAVALVAGAILSPSSSVAAAVASTALASAKAAASASFFGHLFNIAKNKTIWAGAAAVLVGSILVWQNGRNQNPPITQRSTLASPRALTVSNTVATATTQTNNSSASTKPSGPQMLLTVVEAETSNPLPNAKLWVAYFGDPKRRRVRTTTGTNGTVSVPKAQGQFAAVNLFVTVAGHVPKVIKFGGATSMPDAYTLRLEQGASIAGVVVDQSGRPIPNAKIEIDGAGSNPTSQVDVQFGPDDALRSDSSGHWSSDRIPKTLDALHFNLTHPQYARAETNLTLRTADSNNIRFTMSDGFEVSGTVVDLLGAPIADVKVRKIWISYSLEEAATKTDATGKFEFKHTSPGEIFLAARTDGYAPAVTNLQVNSSLTDVRLQLTLGQLLRVRVLGDDDAPITNALLRTVGDQLEIDKVDWSARSSSDGTIEWNSAPADPLKYAIDAKGFNSAYDLTLTADGHVHDIKLTRTNPKTDQIKITGTVTDADTGQPINNFKILSRKIDPDWAPPYSFMATGTNGTFTVFYRTNGLGKSYQVKIETDGYLPAVSADLATKDVNQTLTFELQKGTGPSGTVLLSDGTPAIGASVLLCTPEAGVRMENSRVEPGINTTTYRTTTDDNGQFTLQAAPQYFGIVIVHDQGYAELSFTTANQPVTITLQSWGAIQGTLTLDSKPAPNEHIAASKQEFRFDNRGRQSPFATASYETDTDASGNFSINKVRPGAYKIFRRYQIGSRVRLGFDQKEIVVKPGETTQVELGGTGRTVVGKIGVAVGNSPIDLKNALVVLNLQDPDKPATYPRHTQFSTVDDYIAAATQWDASMDRSRAYGTVCNPDGTFRITDVPPGAYNLDATYADDKANSVTPSNRLAENPDVASAHRDLIIPDLNPGQSNDPINTGTIQLAPATMAP